MKSFYNTLGNCVEKMYSMINFKTMSSPQFDLALNCPTPDTKQKITAQDVSGWFGIKQIREMDEDDVVLYIAHYGGGGSRCVELEGENSKEEKNILLRMIEDSSDACGYPTRKKDYVYMEVYYEER